MHWVRDGGAFEEAYGVSIVHHHECQVDALYDAKQSVSQSVGRSAGQSVDQSTNDLKKELIHQACKTGSKCCMIYLML